MNAIRIGQGINEMLREWDEKYPKRLDSIFGALQNVAPSQLADRNLFDFNALTLARDDKESVFMGEKIQSGMITPELEKMGVTANPDVQTFDPKFANSKKIPTINPII